jgi:hypothetical protein
MRFESFAFASMLTAAAMTAGTRAAQSAESDPYCPMFLETQKEMSGSQGEHINRLTAFAGVEVRCAEKVIEFRQAVGAPGVKLRNGWQERLRLRWSSAYCQPGSKSLEAMRSGWTIATTVTTSDGSEYRLTADCQLPVAGRDSLNSSPSWTG